MKARTFRKALCVLALLLSASPAPAEAAQDIRADIVIQLATSQPTHQLVQASRIEVPYGTSVDTLGFAPRGPERQAIGPVAFDVDEQGALMVADAVRGKIVRLSVAEGKPVLSPVADLPLPFTDLAVDRDGILHVADLRTRSVRTIGSASIRTSIPGTDTSFTFLRRGRDLLLASGGVPRSLRGGAVRPVSNPDSVHKCNAEAGLLTMGGSGKTVQIELGASLASIRLIGVSSGGDTFLAVEQFRQRGRLDVSRHVLVLNSSGAFKARLDIADDPVIVPAREFVLGPKGDLHQMVPGAQGVVFRRWEVRP
jgi:hypothetical protein